jgi:hypothetical protein
MHHCAKWVHENAVNVKGSLEMALTMFVCRRCKGNMKDVNVIENSVTIGEGVELEKVRKFCCLGDMLDADGGVDSTQ